MYKWVNERKEITVEQETLTAADIKKLKVHIREYGYHFSTARVIGLADMESVGSRLNHSLLNFRRL